MQSPPTKRRRADSGGTASRSTRDASSSSSSMLALASAATPTSHRDGEEAEPRMRKGLKVNGRVHRACNPCRKQKMRCEGLENAPCRRCQAMGLECIFEKPPSKETSLTDITSSTSSAGVERLQRLEEQMLGMQTALTELAAALRAGSHAVRSPPPSPQQQQQKQQQKQQQQQQQRHHQQQQQQLAMQQSPAASLSPTSQSHAATAQTPGPRWGPSPVPIVSHPSKHADGSDTSNSTPFANPGGPPAGAMRRAAPTESSFYPISPRGRPRITKPTDLPSDQLDAPIEALRDLADAAAAAASAEQSRCHTRDGRDGAGLSTGQSGSDAKAGGAHAKTGVGGPNGLGPASDSPLPRTRGRSSLVRRQDVVEAGLVDEAEARRHWNTFGSGCSQFVSIFDFDFADERATGPGIFDETRRTSAFLFDTIIAIGARVEAGARPSDVATRCLDAAKEHARHTLFRPCSAIEDCQAMILLASYVQDGYWLLCGHACRMAQELGLDQAFRRLMELKAPQSPSSTTPTTAPEAGNDGATSMGSSTAESVQRSSDGGLGLKELARAARVWCFVFLLEHQLSYGAGRPTMLSYHWVRNCRKFLDLGWPLCLPTDPRFVSTLELMVIREQRQDILWPFDRRVDEAMLERTRSLEVELSAWREHWSRELRARGFAAQGFFVQSLALQGATAHLYLCCTALRGVHLPADAQPERMGQAATDVARGCMRAAAEVLEIATGCQEYLAALQWAPHYTHVTATFACVYLLKGVRLRLVTGSSQLQRIFARAETLALRLKQTPAPQYGDVILRMLWTAWTTLVAEDKREGLRLMLGEAPGRVLSAGGTITPADVDRAGVSSNDFEVIVQMLQLHEQQQQQQQHELQEQQPSQLHRGQGTATSEDLDDALATERQLDKADAERGSTWSGVVGRAERGKGSARGHDGPGDSTSASAPPGSEERLAAPLSLPLWVQESSASGGLGRISLHGNGAGIGYGVRPGLAGGATRAATTASSSSSNGSAAPSSATSVQLAHVPRSAGAYGQLGGSHIGQLDGVDGASAASDAMVAALAAASPRGGAGAGGGVGDVGGSGGMGLLYPGGGAPWFVGSGGHAPEAPAPVLLGTSEPPSSLDVLLSELGLLGQL